VQTEFIESHANDDGMSERVEAARRTRSATAVVAIIFLTRVLAYLYQSHFRDTAHSTTAMALMAVVGLTLLATRRTASSEEMTESVILKFYKSHRFYGAVITASAALVFIYAQFIVPKAEVHALAVPVLAPPVSILPTPPAEPPISIKAPSGFPKLTLTGVTIGNLSSAIINGKTVYEGETIERVRIIKVTENYALVELDGYTNGISRFDQHKSSTVKGAAK
jgi:hypothetical protein